MTVSSRTMQPVHSSIKRCVCCLTHKNGDVGDPKRQLSQSSLPLTADKATAVKKNARMTIKLPALNIREVEAILGTFPNVSLLCDRGTNKIELALRCKC